jgi:hypothetical protein
MLTTENTEGTEVLNKEASQSITELPTALLINFKVPLLRDGLTALFFMTFLCVLCALCV